MRLIDADSLTAEIIALINEYERRVPVWSPNDMLSSGRDAAQKYGYKADGAEAALNVVNKMPTIDAEPVKHAKWYAPASCDPREWCSNCHERTRWFFDEGFCPNCGARMDGEAE